MGNLTSLEMVPGMENFNLEDPTPLDEAQTKAITRSKTTRRLDFSLQNLIDIPIQVFQLENLTSVNFSVNKLKVVPEELWLLVGLENLDLSSNELEELSPRISRLEQLKNLNLRHNYIPALPPMSTLTKLEKVNLEYNILSTLPDLGALRNLAEVKVKFNRLSELPDGFMGFGERSPGLLDLQENGLVKPPPFDQLARVNEVNLTNNCLTALPDSLGSLSHIRKLIASGNKIAKLPTSLRNLSTLTELDLRENDVSTIPVELCLMSALEKLNMASNQISDIPPEMWSLAALRVLNLGSNKLSFLPEGINKLVSLRELLLGDNLFKMIPPDVMALPNLDSLFLGWNQLTRVDPSIGNMTKLSVLHLTGNQLSDLPEEIGRATCLQQLYLAANKITTLPDSLQELKHLALLDVRANTLMYLPSTLGNSKTKSNQFLEWIDISDNPGAQVSKELKEKKMLTIVESDASHKKGDGKAHNVVMGHADMRGKRRSMEDAMANIYKFRGNTDEHYIGVFDGHGGDKCAQVSAERHPEIFGEQLEPRATGEPVNADDAARALSTSFVATSEEMTQDVIKSSGTTAVVAYLADDILFIACAGDSRAVLCTKGVAQRVSLDHKPDLPTEEKRIRNLGGFVSPNGRLVGMLAVSRAFGDIDLQPFVSAVPYVNVLDISETPDFLILACDGVWDVISDETACRIVATEPDPDRASMKLRDLAYCFGSLDNITACVVRFNKKK